MIKKRSLISVTAIGVALVGVLIATCTRSEKAVLTIVWTSFPTCQARVYTVTPNFVTVTKVSILPSNVAIKVKTSQALLDRIHRVPIAALHGVYTDPDCHDGFSLEFLFDIRDQKRKIELHNVYLPELYAVLDECDKVLPAESQFFGLTEYFIQSNREIDRLITEYTQRDIPQEFLERIIDQLQRKRVHIER